MVAAETFNDSSSGKKMSHLLSCVLVLVALSGSLHSLPVGEQGNAWVRSGKYQGDIIIKDGNFKNGVIKPSERWPDNTLVYMFAPDGHDSAQREAILSAFDVIKLKTCIMFREALPTDEDFVYITAVKDDGCSSAIGFQSGNQSLNLEADRPIGEGCFEEGTIVHEVMHALGFYHMQSNYNRDDYVEIHLENVKPGEEYNFDKEEADVVTDFGVAYDYGSLMHYGRKDFSINTLDTIVPKDPNAVIGEAKEMTESDILKINLMYKCP